MVLIGTVACNDFLEETPKSFIAPQNFYKTEGDALASMYSIYDALGSGNGVYYRWYRDLTLMLSDEGYGPTNNSLFWTLNTYTHDGRNTMITQLWQFTYAAIDRANATIDNVTEMTINQQLKDQIIGEAKFLRALNYFNLVRLYGPVPLSLEETKSVNGLERPTSSIEDIYKAILDDLIEAEKYVPVRKRGSAAANGLADLGAVKMLLAKVYMTMAGYPLNDAAKWPLALEKAKELYTSRADYGFGLWSNYLDAFEPKNENGKEDIFSIQFKAGFGAPFVGEGSLQHIDVFQGIKGRRGNYLNRPSEKLFLSFNSTDKRLLALPNFRIVLGDTTYFADTSKDRIFYKFVEQDVVDKNSAPNDTEKNFPVYRYSDLLLMLAEAENEVNGPAAAYPYLKEVTDRAGVPEATGLSKDEMRTFLMDERMRELHNEGSRWFDMVRQQMIMEEVAEASTINSVQIPGIPQEHHYFLPYPVDELAVNDQISQRPGY